MRDETDLNLPELRSRQEALDLKPFEHVTPTDSEQDIIRKDIEAMNTLGDIIHIAWAGANSIDKVCKMTKTTMEFLTTRRTLCNKQLGAPRDSGNQSPRDIEVPTLP